MSRNKRKRERRDQYDRPRWLGVVDIDDTRDFIGPRKRTPLNDASTTLDRDREILSSLSTTTSGGVATTSVWLSQRYHIARRRHWETYWSVDPTGPYRHSPVTSHFCTGISGRQLVNRRPPATRLRKMTVSAKLAKNRDRSHPSTDHDYKSFDIDVTFFPQLRTATGKR